MCCSLLSAVAIAQTPSSTPAAGQPEKADGKKYLRLKGNGLFKEIVTVRVESEKKVYYGRPIGQDSKKLAMLRWDGRISLLPRQDKMEIFSVGFAPYTAKEMEKRLKKQYGKRYLTQSSEHFTVVYPRTSQKNWAAQYETVYRQFSSYLSRHKIDIVAPKFPMVVVVLGSRREFDRSLAGEIIFKKGVFGYYSRISNRVTTFVSADPKIKKQVEQLGKVTLIHEAVHQIAFNTGVHNRLCAVPRWMSEGFAMLFESNGFRAAKPNQPVSARVNKRRLAALKKLFLSNKIRGDIETLLRDDRIFLTDPDVAYALSWGLSFYLAEKDPEKYLKFVVTDGNTNQFANYTPDQRVELFVKTFETNFDTLERRLKKFILAL